MRGLSLVVASGGHSSSRCAGLSLSRPLVLRSTGSRRAGSVTVAHGPSCSAACGIFPDQRSNPCPLHWQADSQPLRHQGSPKHSFYMHWESKKVVCHFIAIFTLSQWSGTEPIISPRYACTGMQTDQIQRLTYPGTQKCTCSSILPVLRLSMRYPNPSFTAWHQE